MFSRILIYSLIFFLPTVGCVRYEKKPLVSEDILKEVESLRSQKGEAIQDKLTFHKTALLMSEYSPQLDLIRARYQLFKRIAEIKTPWLNPVLSFGPNIGTNLGSGVGNKVSPFVGLGFTIPLGGKLKKNNELNTAIAQRSFVEVQARHRELYLELRKTYAELFFALQKEKLQNELVEYSRLALKSAKTFLDSGAFDPLEFGMFEVEHSKVETDLFEIKKEIESKVAELSILLGVDLATQNLDLELPLSLEEEKLLIHDELKMMIVENNLQLARLRFDYEVAEKKLRLEVSKQYPDIDLGGEGEKDVGEKKIVLGLRIGFSIPIFDRNQQGIAEAQMKREEIKIEYIAHLHVAFSNLTYKRAKIVLCQNRLQSLQTEAKTKSEDNLKLADLALKSGRINIFKYLNVLKTHHDILKSTLQAKADLSIAWLELESVVNKPLIAYPGGEPLAIDFGSSLGHSSGEEHAK